MSTHESYIGEAVALAADAPVILETPAEGIDDDVRLLKSL